MSASLQKIIVIGKVGRDPEFKMTPSGTAMLKFSVATDKSKKNESGAWDKKTTWWNVIMFKKQAENAERFIKKGSLVYIEGELEIQEYEDKKSSVPGAKKTWVQIIANNYQNLGGSKSPQEMDELAGEPAVAKPVATPTFDDPFAEDIPF